MDGREALGLCIDGHMMYEVRIAADLYVAQLERERDEARAHLQNTMGELAEVTGWSERRAFQILELKADLAALRAQPQPKIAKVITNGPINEQLQVIRVETHGDALVIRVSQPSAQPCRVEHEPTLFMQDFGSAHSPPCDGYRLGPAGAANVYAAMERARVAAASTQGEK